MDTPVLDALSNPALLVGADGRVRRANVAAVHFWGHPELRLTDFTLEQLFGADSAVAASVRRAVALESSYTIAGYRHQPEEGGPTLYLRVQIDPVTQGQEPVDAVLVLLWDQTQHELLETEAREERLRDAIGVMVRRLAHELQNPLSGVKGATQLLARQLRDQPAFAEYPRVILKELERLERLVKTMLGYGAEPPLQRSAFNLHELLDEVIWFEANSGAPVRFVREYDPSLPELVADRDRMHQVFLNLIRNAVEMTPPEGRVTVRTGIEGPWGRGGGLGYASRPHFRIQVEDEGPGVSEEAQARLFTPFYTTKKAGTGLGLAISQQIVRAHEGALRYRSGPHGGAVFAVLLPLQEPAGGA